MRRMRRSKKTTCISNVLSCRKRVKRLLCLSCFWRVCTRSERERAEGRGPACLVGLSREITSSTKMDGYISCSNNSRLFGGNGRVTGLLVQAVIATMAEQAKKITLLTEKENFTNWKSVEKVVTVLPTPLDWEPISGKTKLGKTHINEHSAAETRRWRCEMKVMH